MFRSEPFKHVLTQAAFTLTLLMFFFSYFQEKTALLRCVQCNKYTDLSFNKIN